MPYYYSFKTDRDSAILGKVILDEPLAHLSAGADIKLGESPGYKMDRYRIKSVTLLNIQFGLGLADQNIEVEVFAKYPIDDE